MSTRFYTIQIAPEGSGKVRTFRIARGYLRIIWVFLFFLVVGSLIVFIKLAEINAVLLSARYIKAANEKLMATHKEYELAFEELDSIYSMETQIHNILQTYLLNDSAKKASILARNRFKHVPSEKTRIHLDHIYDYDPGSSSRHEVIPNILPVVGVISKRFSREHDHPGVDFATALNEPVFATAHGTVIFAGDKGDLGLTITIDHKNGYKTSYSHLGNIQVRKGDNVLKGSTIGTVGMTGNTSGPHLHYEIHLNDKQVDPESIINE